MPEAFKSENKLYNIFGNNAHMIASKVDEDTVFWSCVAFPIVLILLDNTFQLHDARSRDTRDVESAGRRQSRRLQEQFDVRDLGFLCRRAREDGI